MARSDLLPIYVTCYQLIREVFACTVKFPKEYKYLLGTALNEHAMTLCCLISQLNHTTARQALFDDFFAALERVRLVLRLSADYNLLSCKKQAHLATLLEDITAQATAWQKSHQRKESQTNKI